MLKGKYSRMFYFRGTPEEYAWLKAMAQNERRTMADMVRQCIAEAAEHRGLVDAGKPQRAQR